MFNRYESLTDTNPKPFEDWDSVAQWMNRHRETDSKESAPLFAPHILKELGSRKNADVTALSAWVADLDDQEFTHEMRVRFQHLHYFAYTTHSHTSTNPHWRVIFPFSDLVKADAWPEIWERCRNWFGVGIKIDKSCKDAARFYFIPSHRKGSEHELIWNVGEQFLNPASLHTSTIQQTSDEFLKSASGTLASYNAGKTNGRHGQMISEVMVIENLRYIRQSDPSRIAELEENLKLISEQFFKDVTTGHNARTLDQAKKEIHDAIASARKKVAENPPTVTESKAKTSVSIPEEFWNARPIFQEIKSASHRSIASADMVLGCVFARVATLIHPTFRIPNFAARAGGSFNFFTAIIGYSGLSKSSAQDTAEQLIPNPNNERIIFDAPMGSGEGFIEAFLGTIEVQDEGKKKPRLDKAQTRDAVLFKLDEGEQFAALGERKGATLPATIRSAWVGQTLGQSNASQETKRILPAHKYRASLIIAFQPELTEHLITQQNAGTPQRFYWVNSVDPSLPVGKVSDRKPLEPLKWDRPLYRPDGNNFIREQTLSIDQTILDELEIKQSGKVSGALKQIDETESHRDLLMMKLSALLAILDSRMNITREDWNLAGILADTSANVWRDCTKINIEKHQSKAEASIKRHISREIQTDSAKHDSTKERASKNVSNFVHQRHPTAQTKRDITRSIASRDRQIVSVDEIIQAALNKGWIKAEGELFVKGDVIA
jgi:hypothetical protein